MKLWTLIFAAITYFFSILFFFILYFSIDNSFEINCFIQKKQLLFMQTICPWKFIIKKKTYITFSWLKVFYWLIYLFGNWTPEDRLLSLSWFDNWSMSLAIGMDRTSSLPIYFSWLSPRLKQWCCSSKKSPELLTWSPSGAQQSFQKQNKNKTKPFGSS